MHHRANHTTQTLGRAVAVTRLRAAHVCNVVNSADSMMVHVYFSCAELRFSTVVLLQDTACKQNLKRRSSYQLVYCHIYVECRLQTSNTTVTVHSQTVNNYQYRRRSKEAMFLSASVCLSVCPLDYSTRKPCCRKETARCRSCSFRFKVRRRHSLQV